MQRRKQSGTKYAKVLLIFFIITFIALSIPLTAQIALDTFESGNLSGGTGWDRSFWYKTGDVSISSSHSHTGSYSLRIRSNGYTSRDVNLIGESEVTVSLWWRASSFESSDYAEIQNTDRVRVKNLIVIKINQLFDNNGDAIRTKLAI